MRIYTRTGDTGETGLFGGQRVRKDDLRIAACGSVDELNSVLGIVRSFGPTDDLDTLLITIQNDLFATGADLATPFGAGETHGSATVKRLTPDRTSTLEPEIDRLEGELTPLSQFILPGGSIVASYLHFARTVCRRAERQCVALASVQPINPEVGCYINRLSDLLFVMARVTNKRSGLSDVPWTP